MTHGNATTGSVPWVGEREYRAGHGLLYWIAHSIQYRGGPGTIDVDHPWLPAAENPRVQAVNCSVCKGTCRDRDWAKVPGQAGGGPGTKCTPMKDGQHHSCEEPRTVRSRLRLRAAGQLVRLSHAFQRQLLQDRSVDQAAGWHAGELRYVHHSCLSGTIKPHPFGHSHR